MAIATKLKQKTLIITHTVFLRDQWQSEIEKCLGIKAGVIGSGKYDIKSPIVVSNIQSLKKYVLDIRDKFGTIIVDEVHRMPANIFKEVVGSFKARYKVGLSATLWRKDGKHVMLQDYMGTKLYQPPDENNIKPIITIVQTNIKFESGSNTPWGTKVTQLINNPAYIELVLNLSQAQASRGFKVLTVSDRTEFLTTCAEILDNFKLIIGPTDDRSFDHNIYDGIFGSKQIFMEGINIPPLSCLILGTPTNNRAVLEQLIGRVCRLYEGKNTPEVIDIALEGNTAKSQLATRINFYVEKGYKIRYI